MRILIEARNVSANPKSPNAKVLNPKLVYRPTIIKYHPLAESAMAYPHLAYRHALRILADRVLKLNANFILERSRFVLAHTYDCHSMMVKFNFVGAAHVYF